MFPSGIASRGSFKRQIILTFVVGFFALATTFAVYMVESERTSLYRDSGNTTTGLAQSLAVSSLSWVLANDVVGLQEVMQSFRDYPELNYAMVISPSGRVLAHSDAAKVGQFLTDEQSQALVKAVPAKRVLRDDESVIDVVVPIEMGKRHVGWARIGLGREAVAANLHKMIWNVTLFVLLATALSLLAAALVVNRLGRRIGSLVTVAKDVQAGNFATRVPNIPGSEDEITKLANGLNLMLDALARNEERLRAASLYTRSLIEASLDPLVTINPEGKITDVNKATEAATGRSRSELIGTDFSDCFAEPDQAQKAYQEAFLKGFVSNYPLVLRRRDGQDTNMLYNASVYQNEKGEVLGVFASARDITEHRRAEFARSQLAALVESSSDAIIGKTPDGIITSWNRGAENIYGYSADEIVGRSITVLAPPSLHAEIHGILEKVGKGDTVTNYESERIRKDGTRFHVALTLSPIRDESGNISGISTIARDITQRKLDESALHRLNRELHAISNCNLVLMRAEDEQTLLDEICRIVCDEAGYRMAWVGYPENDEAKTIHPVAWAGVEDGYLSQAGITWADTERGRGPSGIAIRNGKSACIQDFSTDPQAAPWRESAMQRGYRSTISLPLKDESAKTFGVLNIYAATPNAFTPEEVRLLEELAGDMAFGIMVLRARIERKRAEENLRLMNERYALSTRAARLGVWDWDLQKNELVWDDRMYELYGVKREEFSGAYEAWLRGVHPDDRAPSDEISKQAQRGEREYDTEFRVVWPDGSIHYLKAYGQFVRDAEGKPLRMTGVNFDITGLKQAENKVNELNRDLEKRVDERTAQLEAANKELEAFSYSVSHDLRTPLRAIDGFSHILIEDYRDKLDDEGKRLLNVVRDNTSRMGQLIDDILKFSRTGRLEMTLSEIDMEKMAREVSEELQSMVANGTRLQFEIEHIPQAKGDRAMLRQVFVNLLSNAIKFSRNREVPKIQVGATVKDGETIYSVKDNGAGFDMQFADKLFGVFQRLHSVNEFEGTGIGLAIVKRIITRHGGRVWAEGKVNEGATMYFSIPFVSQVRREVS